MRHADQKISKVDAVLHSLREERHRSTDPADILRVTESIDLRLDERLRLMRDRDRQQQPAAVEPVDRRGLTVRQPVRAPAQVLVPARAPVPVPDRSDWASEWAPAAPGAPAPVPAEPARAPAG